MLLINTVRKKLDKYLNEEFRQRASMEVTKKVSIIIKDSELLKKLAYINVDEEYNHRILRKAMEQFKDMKKCFISRGDPNPEITPL